MTRIAVFCALVAGAASAHAGLNLNLNNPYQTVAAPSSGSISVVFTGTVDILLPTFDATQADLEFPSDGSNFLTGAFDPAFVAYLGANLPGVDYTGNLFSITVTSTTANGFYWLNNGSLGFSPLSEFIVHAGNGVQTARDNEFYGVTVVPEPASMAILGLGASALIRRRKR